jgi:hypothetical protein
MLAQAPDTVALVAQIAGQLKLGTTRAVNCETSRATLDKISQLSSHRGTST